MVQAQREKAAYIAGELEAAKRIQTGILPRADLLHKDGRIDLAVSMTPAREVGGDLYDFFLLDADHLFFLIGRRRRQGSFRQHVHGGQQGSLQERNARAARMRPSAS